MLKRFKRTARAILSNLQDDVARRTCDQIELRNQLPASVAEKLLEHQYQQMLRDGVPLPPLRETGWKRYSQTDEDGIIHYIFSIAGSTNRKCVEICASEGKECNSANLLLNRQWTGLLVDGSPAKIEAGKRWYEQHRGTYVYPPRFEHLWVTRDNVDPMLERTGFAGDIDLMSIDLDGVDYWVWEAITAARPRVLVIEYQQHLGPDRAVTVPYSDDFIALTYPKTGWLPNYAGASLAALAKLGARKGYRLVGSNHLCFNAFFVRDDVAPTALPEVPVASCFAHDRAIWSMSKRWPTVAHMPWVEV